MTDADFFKWPDCPPYPPPSWWELRGTELGLDSDQTRFAAALVTLGGPDSRSNSMAASLAGMSLSRTEAFRLARSVKVRKLINEAEETKKGERKPLTDDEIDARIDKMIASPNDLAAAKGIELRERRKVAREERESQKPLITDEEDLANLGKQFPKLAERIKLVKEGRQHDQLLLPHGKTVGETSDRELYPAFVNLGIPDLDPELNRFSLIELLDAEVRKIKEDAGNRAVDEWLSRKRVEFANAI
jgi:hypothetical protein